MSCGGRRNSSVAMRGPRANGQVIWKMHATECASSCNLGAQHTARQRWVLRDPLHAQSRGAT